MNDWTDGPAGYDRRGGVAEPTRVVAGRVGHGNGSPLPTTRTAPLPGMPSPTAPGRDGYEAQREEGADGGGVHDRGGRSPKPRRTRRRRIMRLAILLLSALLVSSIGTYVWADAKLDQEVGLGALTDRPSPGKGTNYLIVGSDSRDGLSEQDKK